jgi:hypothetical protein
MFLADSPGDIPVLPGDRALEGHEFGLIRIDAQWSTIDVLQGLSGTIRRNWPVLFVNVWDRTRGDVEALLRRWGYQIAEEHVRADAGINLVFTHGVS